MLRGLTTIFALGLAGAMLSPVQGQAAGRSVAPAMAVRPSVAPVPARGDGAAGPRTFGHHSDRLVRSHRRGFIERGFVGGPWLPFYDAPRIASLRETEREAEPPIDRNSVAHLPARTGIPYPPTPDPILIRLEGRRDRPVARIVRIAEAQGSPRGRFAHAPTGALLLTVPGR